MDPHAIQSPSFENNAAQVVLCIFVRTCSSESVHMIIMRLDPVRKKYPLIQMFIVCRCLSKHNILNTSRARLVALSNPRGIQVARYFALAQLRCAVGNQHTCSPCTNCRQLM
eukprot:jgi/Ulvmu1/3311/UM154_0002.1